MTRRRRLVSLAALPLLLATPLLAGCGNEGETTGGAAMDHNMAAKADQMEADANSRANAMAGDMLSHAEPLPADNAVDAGNQADAAQ